MSLLRRELRQPPLCRSVARVPRGPPPLHPAAHGVEEAATGGLAGHELDGLLGAEEDPEQIHADDELNLRVGHLSKRTTATVYTSVVDPVGDSAKLSGGSGVSEGEGSA